MAVSTADCMACCCIDWLRATIAPTSCASMVRIWPSWIDALLYQVAATVAWLKPSEACPSTGWKRLASGSPVSLMKSSMSWTLVSRLA